ncbi:Uncharacterised protein [uncultured archaeon]|nr:Uncharacterised protein [uncultured archaeon]
MAKQALQSINWTTLGVVLLVILGFLAAITYLVPNSSSEKTISVTGTAQISVPPDKVVIYVQVQTRSNTSANEAKDLNANISDAVLASLLKAGVDKSGIETGGFSVNPEYDWTQDKGQVLKGYVATNSMTITLSDFDNAGKVVDAAVNSGGLISYINYDLSVSKLNEYKATVLVDASKDAKTKAESIASGLGKSLGDIVSVDSSDYNYWPYQLYGASEAGATPAVAKQVATNLPSANIDVSSTVSVVYRIA